MIGWRLALAAALLAFAPALAPAQTLAQAEDVRIEIFEHGLYTADVERHVIDPNGVGRNELANICHVATTTTVPTIYSLHFGFRFRIEGDRRGEMVSLRKVVIFPTTLRPTEGPRPLATYEYSFVHVTGSTSFTGYSFDHAWELETGPWTMQIWQGDRKLAEMTFDVVEGRGQPAPRSGNTNCFRLS